MAADKGKEEKIAMRVSRNSIAANFLLSAAKLAAGLAGHSGAMVSDAIHSASDVLSTIVVMVGVKVSSRESDKNHQYGHERLESVAALILAVVLAATGFGIGYNGLRTIIAGTEGGRFTVPTLLPLAAAVVSILVKEGMYWYTIRAAAAIRSDALRADAWHHRSDALSSVGSLAGIVGGMVGYPRADALAAVVLSAVVLFVAVGIARDSLRRLVDRAADPELTAELRKAAASVPGVLSVDVFRTRLFGERVDADVEIGVRADLPLRESHEIAEQVRAAVCAFEPVKECTVHVNPKEDDRA